MSQENRINLQQGSSAPKVVLSTAVRISRRHETAERTVTGPACLRWLRCVTPRGHASHPLSLVRGLLKPNCLRP